MSRLCPRPCGKLATATVFIIVGVVQFLVGIILLRSKFANLLSGPDFMTASSNIGFGCVYGILSSVWRSNKKRKSVKQAARRNVLASLLVSIIAVNATTAVILIMGEGNALLIHYLDQDASELMSVPAAFTNEVFAFAYVTSVCSPIVVIVVALVAVSGSFFYVYSDECSEEKLKKNIPKLQMDSKERGSRVEIESTSTESQSSSSDDSVFSGQDGAISGKRGALLLQDNPSPYSMWRMKQERIMQAMSRKRSFLDGYVPSVCGDSIDVPNQEDHGPFSNGEHSEDDRRFRFSIGSENLYPHGDEDGLDSRESGTTPHHEGGHKSVSLSIDDCAVDFGERDSSHPRHPSTPGGGDVDARPSVPAKPNWSQLKAQTLEELERRVKQILPAKQQAADAPGKSRKSCPDVAESSFDGDGRTLPHRRQQLSSEASSASSPYPPRQTLRSLKRNQLERRSAGHSNSDLEHSACFSPNPVAQNKENVRRISKAETMKQKLREKKVASMDSITEDPFQEQVEEDSSITSGSSRASGKESPLRTLLRRASVSSNNLLKRVWSTPNESKVDVSDLIVDQDSLIGLSEEELIARTNRIRSLSKVIAKRLKSEAPSGDGSAGSEF